MRFEPELMVLNSGEAVDSAQKMELRRKEILTILQEYAYGDYPSPVPVEGTILEETSRCCSGTAVYQKILIGCKFGEKRFSFPLQLLTPEKPAKKPLIFCINFRDSIPDEYIPAEEIVDNGFALAVLYYNDVTNDDGDFNDKLAAFYPRTGSGRDPAKISLWAWSVSRALDHLLTRADIDETRIALIGHSRLGKTALWCAANDTRIRCVCSNDSGCMGTGYARAWMQGAESTALIEQKFPYWFCENFKSISSKSDNMPFDQHMLIAAVAPRYVLINSASKDDWANPPAEQLSCVGASPAWQAYGKTGYTGHVNTCGVNEGSLEGELGYYKRYGIHFLGRKDWLNFIAFIKMHD